MEALPEEIRPTTEVDGYAIQALVETTSLKPLSGWKIAATSKAGQKHIGADGPMLGRLLAERCHPSGTMINIDQNRMRVAEAEFAFRMGRTLRPRDGRYAVSEVMAAVDALHVAIEVPDSRYADFATVGAPSLIADNACAFEFVLGPEAPAVWRTTDLGTLWVLGRVNGQVVSEGKGEHVLGDPRVALTWLANTLSSLHIPLDGNQVVTTGTCLVPMPIAPGNVVEADFGTLGRVEVQV